MAASVYGSRNGRLLRLLGQYGDQDGSRDNTSVSWAEFQLFDDDVTSLPCLMTHSNESCVNVTSLDDGSTYPYTVWQVRSTRCYKSCPKVISEECVALAQLGYTTEFSLVTTGRPKFTLNCPFFFDDHLSHLLNPSLDRPH